MTTQRELRRIGWIKTTVETDGGWKEFQKANPACLVVAVNQGYDPYAVQLDRSEVPYANVPVYCGQYYDRVTFMCPPDVVVVVEDRRYVVKYGRLVREFTDKDHDRIMEEIDNRCTCGYHGLSAHGSFLYGLLEEVSERGFVELSAEQYGRLDLCGVGDYVYWEK